MSDARTDMLEAAERLGAEQGLAAMSLRAVQAAAGQRNKSAAQYHFGTREGLIEAIVARRMGPINERRQELLLALDERGDTASVDELVAVLVVPLARAVLEDPASRWARFLLQGMADPVLGDVVRTAFEGTSYRAVRARLGHRLDHLPTGLRTSRVDRVTGLLILSLAGLEATGRPAPDPAVAVADMVLTCTAALTAPAPSDAAIPPIVAVHLGQP